MKRLSLLIPLVILLVGCGGKSGSTANETTGGNAMDCVISGDKSKAELKTFEDGKKYEVVVNTSKGSFTFDLATDISPCTTASIAGLVEKGFYDGLVFHRIVHGFVIQGGDPSGDGTGGPGYSTVDAPPTTTTYDKGLVAMAKAGPEPAGTSGSQFFVVSSDGVQLPPEYAVLGRVTDGLDVVEKIGSVDVDANDKPIEAVEIKDMQLKSG
jgi:peptidyl-prolyl cis-trans isomerase B (cyclophilin B)